MKIELFQFQDKSTGWMLSPINFFPDLTLLVGMSGVGKTKILRAIYALRQIAEGSSRSHGSFWGISWFVRFRSAEGVTYTWDGEYESQNSNDPASISINEFPFFFDDEESTPKPKVIRELLTENGNEIIRRDNAGILLRGTQTPKLSPFESALKMLKEEESISQVHRELDRLLFVDHSEGNDVGDTVIFSRPFSKLCEKHPTLHEIREAELPVQIKLALVYENDREAFNRIASRFIEVFPQVTQLFVKRQTIGEFHDVPVIRFSETGVDKDIPLSRMSSGMARTLLHLARMMLWPDGTVVLIDEFENSLGVNCIDFVTQDVVDESRRLQFIITSHHPYIINNVQVGNWKIVSRSGSSISTRDAENLGLKSSSHDAFIKLLNLSVYREGILAK